MDARTKRIALGDRTLVMGIVNVTPDSFFDGGHHSNAEMGVLHGLMLAEQGADILDIGGESTRPGAKAVTAEEEIQRVVPVVKGLAKRSTLPISVDTFKGDVARAALEAGAHIINDVSAGVLDPTILDVVAEYQVPYIAMHMRGTPRTMQVDTHYDDLIAEINGYFAERLAVFERVGIKRELVILDPGIGFAKTPEDNYRLLAHLDDFRVHGCPLLVGASRKSFLKLIGVDDVNDRLPGSLAAASISALAGAEIIRVHDVSETLQAVRVADLVRKTRS